MTATRELDDLDTVSAIWILASNDDNPLITYKGLVHRLGLPGNCDVRSVVASRPEMFRPGATDARISAWKTQLRAGKSVPGWLKEISEGPERDAAIDALTANDIFRSQFRAHSGAERSPIEIIKWGLEHLDRLRKARAEANDASVKRWQMWLVFWVSLLGVVSQFVIAYIKHIGSL